MIDPQTIKTFVELKEWAKSKGIVSLHATVANGASEEDIVKELVRVMLMDKDMLEEYHD